MTKTNIKEHDQKTQAFTVAPSDSLIFKYAVAYLLFYTVGLIGYYVVNLPFSDTLNKYIISYFSYKFDFSSGIEENITKLVCVSYTDIRTCALIFVSGFTMFSSIAIYALLFYHALSLGFSSLYLVNSMASHLLPEVSFFDLVFFLFTNAAICAILILFSSKTRRFNDIFRGYAGRRKIIIRSRPLYVQIFTLLVVFGAVLFINITRFLINIF